MANSERLTSLAIYAREVLQRSPLLLLAELSFSYHKRNLHTWNHVDHSTPQTPTGTDQQIDPFASTPSVLGADLSRVSFASAISTPMTLRNEKKLFSSVGNVDPLPGRKGDPVTVRFSTETEKENEGMA